MNTGNEKLIVILGPTATGKTRLASELSYRFNGEIISADSRQVYRNMNIGTGKDYDDYIVNDKLIPHHLVDIINPDEEFNLFLFKQNFEKSFRDILTHNRIPFLVGGTGLYIDSVLRNYDLREADFDKDRRDKLSEMDINSLRDMLLKSGYSLHNSTDLKNKERIISAIIIGRKENKKNSVHRDNCLVIGVNPGREEVKKRITQRLKSRLASGMIEEVEDLIKSGITFEKLNFFGLEYRYIAEYISGKLNYNDMYQKLNNAIHNFAKRQMTWFRKMEREGVTINWIENPQAGLAEPLITNFLSNE